MTMSFFNKDNKGKRVKLIHSKDTTLKPGDEGTYEFMLCNSENIQHSIKWDNGSTLMLTDGIDSFEFIN